MGGVVLKMLSKTSDIYIFPKGKLGVKIANILDFRIKGFIDNYKQDVFRLKDIDNKNALIIIASISYMYEIRAQLKQEGFNNIVCFHQLIKQFPELKTFNSSFNGLEEDYINHKQKYEKLYKLFSDKKSLQVLNSVIEYRKTFDINLFVKIAEPSGKQYFENFMPRVDVFVDCGAYDGDSILSYINFNPNYKMIYCFEPDCISFEKAKSSLKKYSNI